MLKMKYTGILSASKSIHSWSNEQFYSTTKNHLIKKLQMARLKHGFHDFDFELECNVKQTDSRYENGVYMSFHSISKEQFKANQKWITYHPYPFHGQPINNKKTRTKSHEHIHFWKQKNIYIEYFTDLLYISKSSLVSLTIIKKKKVTEAEREGQNRRSENIRNVKIFNYYYEMVGWKTNKQQLHIRMFFGLVCACVCMWTFFNNNRKTAERFYFLLFDAIQIFWTYISSMNIK